MCLFFGQNVDELVEVGDTSACDELQKFVVAVTSVYCVDDVFSLWPRDTSHSAELINKRIAGVDEIQQLNTIDSQRPHPGFVQWTNVTEPRSDICSNTINGYCLIYFRCFWGNSPREYLMS